MAQLKAIDMKRIDAAIKYLEKISFDHLNDEICTALAVLYNYRRELRNNEEKQHVVSQ